MSTKPLTTDIEALTTYANSVTSAGDTCLSDAVYTLANKYGKATSGTYIPAEDGATFTIDTGVTGWTHFLIVVHSLPYSTGLSRCLGLRYVDTTLGLAISAYSSSSSSSTNISYSSSLDISLVVSISGSIISWIYSVAGYVGQLQGGTQYDWYCW